MALDVVVLGPPGAGKGTQASRLAVERGVPQIATGDILRDAIQAGTDLGRQAEATIDAGELVSDEVMIGIVRERLNQPDARGGFILDGFPRTVTQAVALDEMLNGRDPLIVIEIPLPEEEILARLSRRRVCSRCGANADEADSSATACARCGGALVQRNDDATAVVRERLKVYARDTRPLIEYYRTRPTFRSIDGNQTPDRVARALSEAVDAAAQASHAAARAGRETRA